MYYADHSASNGTESHGIRVPDTADLASMKRPSLTGSISGGMQNRAHVLQRCQDWLAYWLIQDYYFPAVHGAA